MGPAPEDKLPKDATPGRLLTGSLTLAKISGAAGNGDAPGAPTITYVVRAALKLWKLQHNSQSFDTTLNLQKK